MAFSYNSEKRESGISTSGLDMTTAIIAGTVGVVAGGATYAMVDHMTTSPVEKKVSKMAAAIEASFDEKDLAAALKGSDLMVGFGGKGVKSPTPQKQDFLDGKDDDEFEIEVLPTEKSKDDAKSTPKADKADKTDKTDKADKTDKTDKTDGKDTALTADKAFETALVAAATKNLGRMTKDMVEKVVKACYPGQKYADRRDVAWAKVEQLQEELVKAAAADA